jgi:hypothetical protein
MRTLFLDLETFPFGAAHMAPEPVCVQVAEGAGPVRILLWEDPEVERLLRSYLQDGRIVGHWLPYDFKVVLQAAPHMYDLIFQAYADGRIGDTKIADQFWDIAEGVSRPPAKGDKAPYTLANCAKRRLGVYVEKEDTWRRSYGMLKGVPVAQWPQAAKDYAIGDVVVTRDLWNFLTDDGNEPIPCMADECVGAWALELASAYGMVSDPRAVSIYDAQLTATESHCRSVLQGSGIYRADGSCNVNEARKLAEACGVKKLTKGGAFSLDAEALEDVTEPRLVAMREIAHAQKMRSTYLRHAVAGLTAPVHGRYGTAASMRSTSSEPNWQNLPRERGIRECWWARPGFCYITADFSIAELISYAETLQVWVPQRSAMAEALQEGLDLHIVTAAHILRRDYSDVLAGRKRGDPACTAGRELAKILNFGIPGSLGVKAIMRDVNKKMRGIMNIDMREAARLRNLWLDLYPESKQALAQVAALSSGAAWTQVHPLTGFVRGGLGYGDAANNLFQHPTAVATKRALFAVQRACFTPGNPLFSCRVIAFIHDEVIAEAPLGRAAEAAVHMAHIMRESYGTVCKTVPIQVEPLLSTRWSKAAKPVFDRDGRLTVWRDAVLDV